MQIRKNLAQHMQELRQWLLETENNPAEEMSAFFRVRLDGYEEHMSTWKDAYRRIAELLGTGPRDVLDLGCGTGLEIDEILAVHPGVRITGIDLSEDMLQRLREKHPRVRTILADYFAADLGEAAYDAVISFESLHHFTAEKKRGLYQKVRAALRPGGFFLEADYIACCPEEEALLFEMSRRKRRREGIPEDCFVHIDTPLTLEHEIEALRCAGFSSVQAIDCIEGACFIRAEK